jgi:transcriptional regulator with XRE-family HTH domain
LEENMTSEQTTNPIDPRAKIGERLKQAREGLDMTQAALASQAGVARSTIVHYETGKALPGGMELIKLAKALNVTPNYILSGSERFFESEAPEHAVASGDVPLLASRVVLCLMALDQDVRESFSALLMSMIKQKLGTAQYEEFSRMLDALEPHLRQMMPDMSEAFEPWMDEWIEANIPAHLLEKPEE